jgi:enoyl-CoA hydratase/carnithine racemase
MVGEVVPAEQLLTRAFELAALLKVNSPSAMARTKQAIWEAAEQGLGQGLQNAWRLMMDQVRHPDVAEGVKAFVEKRAPRWRPLTDT